MKTMRLWLYGLLTVSGLILASNGSIARAAEGEQEMGQRLDRLERMVHQLAERQRQSNAGPASPNEIRPQGRPVIEPQGGPVDARQMPPTGPGRREHRRCCLGIFLILVAVIHTMLAVWVFTDIRKRGEGSGLFIVIVLLAGILGAILYALIRIGDRKFAERPPAVP